MPGSSNIQLVEWSQVQKYELPKAGLGRSSFHIGCNLLSGRVLYVPVDDQWTGAAVVEVAQADPKTPPAIPLITFLRLGRLADPEIPAIVNLHHI
jgi:hypothetical protein